MKNQPFHVRKIRIQETPKLNPDELKKRTIISLNKMGSQRFSDEPGGYSLDNWARSMKVLLDDFEEKMGEGRLPSDYFVKRRELNELLSSPVPPSSIDGKIAEIKLKIADVNSRIETETERIAARLAELENEQAECSAELAREKARIVNLASERSSNSFFRRLLARKPIDSEGSKSRVEELVARHGVLDEEILGQKKLLKSAQQRSPESPLAGDWQTLESLQTSLEAFESEREESLQFVRIRQEFTTSIADAIAQIPS